MKPQSWLVMEYRGKVAGDDRLLYDVRVRKWHPGFWWFVLTTVWRAHR